MKKIDVYKIALEESLKLQRHYEMLLNMYDDGQRREFKSSEEWIERLKETGKINESPS